jgi:predicted polyphosphate/ATP-dependent NAD kinase
MLETNLKDALKNADTKKSPIGDIACYSMNFAELASEVNVFMEGNKVKFTWREYIKLAQIIWDKIKETSRECAGKEIEVKLPAKLSLISAAFALIGFKL